MAKIVFAFLWVAMLVIVNRALDGITWAQYSATFLLGGLCAILLGKMEILRGGPAPEGSK
ncbi:hypothetical protein ACWC98_31780 [Streptomyces goshikiensis]